QQCVGIQRDRRDHLLDLLGFEHRRGWRCLGRWWRRRRRLLRLQPGGGSTQRYDADQQADEPSGTQLGHRVSLSLCRRPPPFLPNDRRRQIPQMNEDIESTVLAEPNKRPADGAFDLTVSVGSAMWRGNRPRGGLTCERESH